MTLGTSSAVTTRSVGFADFDMKRASRDCPCLPLHWTEQAQIPSASPYASRILVRLLDPLQALKGERDLSPFPFDLGTSELNRVVGVASPLVSTGCQDLSQPAALAAPAAAQAAFCFTHSESTRVAPVQLGLHSISRFLPVLLLLTQAVPTLS